jgi:transposase
MVQDTASALFGVEGLKVTEADTEADGSVTVWVTTDHPDAASCPHCGTRAARVHEYVLTQPRDLRRGLDEVAVCWLKRRWKCEQPACPRRTFTERVPQLPPRCRLTGRLRELAGAEVAGRGITPAEAGRWHQVSWPVAHQAFIEQAEPQLAAPAARVAHLGIDEHRRGRPRWRADEQTGEYAVLADRWHTCFFDLSGDQALLGQVEGRTADDAAYWLAQQPAAWRDAVQVVAIDMCSIYASAVRRMLPHATLVVDIFHVVQLAVKAVGDVRRRVVRRKYGRRGRSGDLEYGVKTLLTRNLEHLSPAQFAKVMDTLGGSRDGQEILAAWIAKEKLRDVLNLRARVTGSAPCERAVHGRLLTFYDWCARHDDIPELASLAKTIARWEDELTAAVMTGVTNAKSESLNRIAKLEARNAYSFRNPANQRRRVRMACTRRSRQVIRRRSLLVTSRKHDPG